MRLIKERGIIEREPLFLFMLQKENRLLKEKEFQSVFQKGRGFYVKEIGAKCAPNGRDATRFGFSLSLKVSKKAVERNRVKRQLRAIVREAMPGIRGGYDCVFVVRPELRDLSFEEKKERVLAILKHLKLFKT